MSTKPDFRSESVKNSRLQPSRERFTTDPNAASETFRIASLPSVSLPAFFLSFFSRGSELPLEEGTKLSFRDLTSQLS